MTAVRVMSVVALGLWLAPAVGAQELNPPPAAAQQDTVGPFGEFPDQEVPSMQRPVSPMGAFWRSFLIPGWGQAKLNRKLSGGLFIAVEGFSLGMVIKMDHQLKYLQRTNDPSAEAKEQQKEDWIAILVFNHLLAGLEAFVSAHLWDFPADLQLQGVPGSYGAQVTVPIRLP
jgi:hypothetical protein